MPDSTPHPQRRPLPRACAVVLAGSTPRKPLAIDLFCGLGGWTDGLLSEGWDVIGFDIERHEYGDQRYPAQLVVQDVLTLDGAQFSSADLIVASPPCQEYSYMAMPWTRAKEKAKAIRADETGAELERLNRLFNACFRIQREACASAGRHIPLVVENVRGAIPWVGRSRWNFGSFHLWGDVPALMPPIFRGSARLKTHAGEQWNVSRKNFTGVQGWDTGIKVPSGDGRRTNPGNGARFTSRDCGVEGRKGYVPEGTQPLGKHGHPRILPQIVNKTGSGSLARKAASAMIAKIPLPLSRHIAATYRP